VDPAVAAVGAAEPILVHVPAALEESRQLREHALAGRRRAGARARSASREARRIVPREARTLAPVKVAPKEPAGARCRSRRGSRRGGRRAARAPPAARRPRVALHRLVARAARWPRGAAPCAARRAPATARARRRPRARRAAIGQVERDADGTDDRAVVTERLDVRTIGAPVVVHLVAVRTRRRAPGDAPRSAGSPRPWCGSTPRASGRARASGRPQHVEQGAAGRRDPERRVRRPREDRDVRLQQSEMLAAHIGRWDECGSASGAPALRRGPCDRLSEGAVRVAHSNFRGQRIGRGLTRRAPRYQAAPWPTPRSTCGRRSFPCRR
jgi:hypothetical protein